MDKEFPRGIVEGFYGPPWSHLDRLYMIRFLSENGFNVYMYAPKDDPYHRAKWRERYPTSLEEKIRELIYACNLYSVNFVFTVSPGLSIKYSDPKEIELLLGKLNFAIELGCRWIGVMLDDIDKQLTFQEDKKKFDTLAAAHVYLLNTLLQEIRNKRGDIRIVFCPTYYANEYLGKKARKNEYLSEIGASMDRSIDILWTGRNVVSCQVTEQDVSDFESVIRRKPFFWDNYPVNDYFRAEAGSKLGLRLNLGPFAGRSLESLERLAGYVSNPMNECEASKISLLTLKDMLDKPEEYSPSASLDKAISIMFSPSEANDVKALIGVAKATPFDPNEAESLRLLVKELISSYHKDERESLVAFSEIRSQLVKYLSLKERLEAELKNRKFLEEIEPILTKLKRLASFGLECLTYLDKIKSSKEEYETTVSLESKKILERYADELIKDKTQVFGEIDFGGKVKNEKAANESFSDLGLPYVKTRSPVIELYEWVGTLE
jgi:hyaluronoglucosaminidase